MRAGTRPAGLVAMRDQHTEREREDSANRRDGRVVTVDQLVQKGQTVMDRVRPVVERLRARFGKK